MVFAPSPRQLTPERAREISSAIKKEHPDFPVVGVFVNLPAERINEIASYCGLDWIQLSGDEPVEYCSKLKRPFIKTFRVTIDASADSKINISNLSPLQDKFKPENFLVLVDTSHGNKYGGTGLTFDWEAARLVVSKYRTIIAGGLDSNNVGKLVGSVSPWGVDVSSGVEIDGVKDIAKIRAFIDAVRRADEIKNKTTA